MIMIHLSQKNRELEPSNINDKRFFFFATEKCKGIKLSYFCNTLLLKEKKEVCRECKKKPLN